MNEEKNEIIDEILQKGVVEKELTKDIFHKIQNEVYKKYKLKRPFPSTQLLERYNELIANWSIPESNAFIRVLRKRGVRSLSWVTVISLLTKFFGCPWKCIYCPTFEGLPKSYIPNEPAVQRAELNKFDPILQIHNRLRALEVTGHKIEKNDVRIIGGTWSVYPKEYREDFIKWIYDAFNSYDEMKKHIEETNLSSDKFASFKIREWYKVYESKTLEEAKKRNETARCRVIGVAIETRPDWITPDEIKELRRYGVTRVEIGYQTTIDEINTLNKRGHGNKESIAATRLLKNAGFKVVAHMMPNLLGSTPELDKKAMSEVFHNPDFRPDELKIYPMMVTDKSELTEVWKAGWFKAYDDTTLVNLMCELEMMIPEYVRINRTYRDIPASEILHWSTLSNLRQIVEEKLHAKWAELVDIRHREIRNKKNNPHDAVLHTYEYEASGWKEYFFTYEDKEDRTIFSLLRLRLPQTIGDNEVDKELLDKLPELNWAALIREIHTFWDQLSIWEKWEKFGQHIGFWKKLIIEAEKIASENGFKKVAVIAWVWVRGYYEKRWYHLEGEYMIKNI